MSDSPLATRRLAGFVVSDQSQSNGLAFKAHDPLSDLEVSEPLPLDGSLQRALLRAAVTPAVARFDRNGRVAELELTGR